MAIHRNTSQCGTRFNRKELLSSLGAFARPKRASSCCYTEDHNSRSWLKKNKIEVALVCVRDVPVQNTFPVIESCSDWKRGALRVNHEARHMIYIKDSWHMYLYP